MQRSQTQPFRLEFPVQNACLSTAPQGHMQTLRRTRHPRWQQWAMCGDAARGTAVWRVSGSAVRRPTPHGKLRGPHKAVPLQPVTGRACALEPELTPLITVKLSFASEFNSASSYWLHQQ